MKMTIHDAFDAFIRDRQVYCSVGTIRTYRGHIKTFYSFLERKYGKPVTELQFSDIPEDDNIMAGYILQLREDNACIRNSTIRSYCRHVKAFLRFCYEMDYCRDFLKRVKMPRDDAAPKMPLCVDEVEQIEALFDRSTLKGSRNYCIFHLMLDCGLRCQEVRHLQVEHLQAGRNILYIKDSKGEKSRFTLAPDFIFTAIREYMQIAGHSSGIIFRGIKDGRPITQNTIKQLFQDMKKETGIDRLHAHLLRHTFATSFLIGGGNLEFLRVYLGHYDYSVTKTYTQMAAQCKMLGLDVYHLDKIFFTRGY